MEFTIFDKAPVWWIMQGSERIAGVHWGLHDGTSASAEKTAQMIVDALNAMDKTK